MGRRLRHALVVLLAAVAAAAGGAEARRKWRTTDKVSAHRGWGPRSSERAVDWLFYDEGKRLSKETGKPALLLFWRNDCAACTRLKTAFQDQNLDAIVELSRRFVMISVEGAEEPTHPQFAPEGTRYAPRVLYINPAGGWRVDAGLSNPAPPFPEYKFYYTRLSQLADSMRGAYESMRPALRLANATGKALPDAGGGECGAGGAGECGSAL